MAITVASVTDNSMLSCANKGKDLVSIDIAKYKMKK